MEEAVNRCARCEMRAPAGAKFCRACRRAAGAAGDDAEPSPARRLGARQYVALALLGGLVALLGAAAVADALRAKPTRSRYVEPVAAAASTAQRPDDAEAADAVAILRAYYEAGQATAAADWRWAQCHDETKGYEAVLACAKGVQAEIGRLRARLPPEEAASGACGREIEQAHRAYIDGQVRFHADVVAWLEQHRGALAGPLRRAALPDACAAAPKACDAQPIDVSERYGAGQGASYARVNGIECTKRLFRCGAEDNVCWVGKVAERLGLGLDARHGDLAVRSTGKRLQ